LRGCVVVVDPFCGKSQYGTLRNDIASGGKEAQEFCADLAIQGVVADAVIFDPPYSPRQIAECYREAGLKVGHRDTQNAALNSTVTGMLKHILKPGGVGLSFGWNSGGLGKPMETVEIMLISHGSAHNDTICVAQRKPL